jgi:hypothetical protein
MRRAIRRYAAELPKLLQNDYGRASSSAPYTAAQVRQTVERNGLSRKYLVYAIAMFADQGGFAEHQSLFGDTHDYLEIRGEIADIVGYSGGNVNYASHDGFASCGPTQSGDHDGLDGHSSDGSGH